MPSTPESHTRVGVAKFVAELTLGASTVEELVLASGLARSTVRLWLHALRAVHVVRITAWERDSTGRAQLAVFGFGDAPDAKRPPKQNSAERQAAARRRYKALTHLGTPLADMEPGNTIVNEQDHDDRTY